MRRAPSRVRTLCGDAQQARHRIRFPLCSHRGNLGRSCERATAAMKTLIITEKSSQAKDLRAALGDRFGHILPAEGHLLRLAEPEEINAEWKRWSCTLLKPDGLYPTRPAAEGNKPSKLKAIAAALKNCDQVILATDCDREGQLIGQEILDHLAYRGRVQRAMFTQRPCAKPSHNSSRTAICGPSMTPRWRASRQT